MNAAPWATPMDNSPEASGRCFFSGCWRSASISEMSLSRYTALEIRQNKKNPSSVRKNGSSKNNYLSKINAKNTKPFFVHWRGRMALMRTFNMRLFYLIEVQYAHVESSFGC